MQCKNKEEEEPEILSNKFIEYFSNISNILLINNFLTLVTVISALIRLMSFFEICLKSKKLFSDNKICTSDNMVKYVTPLLAVSRKRLGTSDIDDIAH